MGAEPTPEQYVARMVEVFREVRRVLRDDGTVFLNLGDSYVGGGGYYPDAPSNQSRSKQSTNGGSVKGSTKVTRGRGLKSGNLVGIPWRVALALQADGWVLRQDIIWHKPSPMPESVRNRCTKAHEYVFLLTKSMDYYCDMEAVKEKQAGEIKTRPFYSADGALARSKGTPSSGNEGIGEDWTDTGMSNKRSVWTADDESALIQWMAENASDQLEAYLAQSANQGDTWRISSQGYPGAHFATFPPRLIEPMILMGTSAHGCCWSCGAPWRRVVESAKLVRERPNDYVKRTGESGTGNSCANSMAGVDNRTVGWEPTCECNGRFVKETNSVRPADAIGMPGNAASTKKGAGDSGASEHFDRSQVTEDVEKTVTRYVSDLPLDQHPVVPCTVLDPFLGSGTTAQVALEQGRRCWGIDLSEVYLRNNAVPRVEVALLGRPATVPLVPGRAVKPLTGGKRLL